MNKTITSILISAALLSGAQGAILVNEQFLPAAYTVGTQLNASPIWTGGNNGMVIANFGLDHPGMQGESGNAVRGNTSFSNTAINRDTIGSDTPLGVGERWFATLVSINDTSGESANVGFSFDSASGSFSVRVGDIGTEAGWFFNGSGIALDTGETQYVDGSTALIVGRMQVLNAAGTGNEPLTIWFNPTLGDSIANLDATADAKHEVSSTSYALGDWGAIDLNAQIRGSSTDTGRIDEIRVGENLSDLNLTAIPEPGSLALVSLTGMALVLALRRKS